jgi:hypothetical protein
MVGISAPARPIFDSIRLARGRRVGGLVSVLACYLDDSDSTISKVETIAGYVADEDGWGRFELLAEKICDRYEIDLVRGRQLDSRKDSFEGWKLPKIERFLEEIGSAMRGNVLFGISRSIEKDRYRVFRQRVLKLDAEHRRMFSNLSGFGFCFGNICHDMRRLEGYGISERMESEGMAFMLESGSRNNPDIHRYVASERQHGNLHVSTTVSEVDKRSCRAIQVADLYAFYSRRRANKFARFEGKLEFIPDIHKLHVQNKILHDSALIKDAAIQGTNLRTGDTFKFHGLMSRER